MIAATKIALVGVACIFAGEPVGWSVDEDTHTRANPGDPLESALRYLGGGCRSVREEPPSEALRGNREISERQFERLRDRRGFAIFDRARLGGRLDGGGEHEVFLAEDVSSERAWRVYKVTHPNYAGQLARAVMRNDGQVRVTIDDATPAEYLQRMMLHNEVFGDGIRFEGIALSDAGPSLVITQPYIVGKIPFRGDAERFLERSRFARMSDGFWYSADRQVGIVDTKPANFIQMSDRGIHPIDIVIFIPTRAMLEVWGIRN